MSAPLAGLENSVANDSLGSLNTLFGGMVDSTDNVVGSLAATATSLTDKMYNILSYLNRGGSDQS